jgi:uncharacterized membrane protein
MKGMATLGITGLVVTIIMAMEGMAVQVTEVMVTTTMAIGITITTALGEVMETMEATMATMTTLQRRTSPK